MEAARLFLIEHYPGPEPVWFGGDDRGVNRVDAFFIGEQPDPQIYFVASLKIDDVFVPDVVSCSPRIPYETPGAKAVAPYADALGVYVSVEAIHSPDATRARFRHRGALREASVIGGQCALFDWNVPWLSAQDRPAFDALFIDGRWIATVSTFVAATPADFRAAYIACQEVGAQRPDWAPTAFFESVDFEEKVRMVECILEGDVPDYSHGCLAAGPVEDLLGHRLLDYIDRDGETRNRWVPLLGGTYWRTEPPDVQERVRSLLGIADTPDPPRRKR